MAQISNHGGNCCGMRHIHGFRADTEAEDVADLCHLTRQVDMLEEGGNARYNTEVILSDRQTRNRPHLVDELANLGYVYTTAWTGQHGTPVHLFHRAKRRLALSSAHFYERWTNNGGMLPHPSLAGTLPLIQPTPRPARNNRERLPAYNYLAVGDRVVVRSDTSQFNGREATIEEIVYSGAGYRARINLYTNAGNRGEIAVGNLVRVVEAAHAPVQPRTYRYPNAAACVFPVPQEGVQQPRRLILSQFYCIFRNTGQTSRVFATLAEGQVAYPRATQWHERKVYSDGEIVEGPVQHG